VLDELCPDVLEWCPDEACPDVLVYGTYLLQPEQHVRSGAVHACRWKNAEEAGGSRLVELDTTELAGVYDLAWGPRADDTIFLAAAVADGTVSLLGLNTGAVHEASGKRPLNSLGCCQVLDGILTHVAWGAGSASGLAAVGQAGFAYHLTISEGSGEPVKVSERANHDMEAWCVEVSAFDSNLLLSGADDGRLVGWDIRSPPEDPPAVVNRKAHEAGVTALACDPLRPGRLATGSYDEKVRVFDLRALSASPVHETERLGDGAYHLAWHPYEQDTLAVAAMRSGLPILYFEGQQAEPTERMRHAAEAEEGCHGSLAYGVSWQQAPPRNGQGKCLAASACFQSRTVQLWSYSSSSKLSDGSAVG